VTGAEERVSMFEVALRKKSMRVAAIDDTPIGGARTTKR